MASQRRDRLAQETKPRALNRLQSMYALRAEVDKMYEGGVKASEEGKPVAWNESHWVDEEFHKLLEKANSTLDVEERRKMFCKLEDIQMERGTIGLPVWTNWWTITPIYVHGLNPRPVHLEMDECWMSTKS